MRTALAIVVLLSALDSAVAQELAPGVYRGWYEYLNSSALRKTATAEVRINKVDGTNVQGVYVRFGSGCGDTPIKGVLEGDTLMLRSDRKTGEVKEGCGVYLDLKVSGKRLEGKSRAGNKFEFSM